MTHCHQSHTSTTHVGQGCSVAMQRGIADEHERVADCDHHELESINIIIIIMNVIILLMIREWLTVMTSE